MLVIVFEPHSVDFAVFWYEFGVPKRVEDSQWSNYQAWLRNLHEIAKGEDGDNDRFLEAASNTCVGRRLFITEKGTLGLGPSALQVGDRCCVLFGGIVQFVLRQRNDGKQALVGECYIKSAMQGEVVQSLRNGGIDTEDFCIC